MQDRQYLAPRALPAPASTKRSPDDSPLDDFLCVLAELIARRHLSQPAREVVLSGAAKPKRARK